MTPEDFDTLSEFRTWCDDVATLLARAEEIRPKLTNKVRAYLSDDEREKLHAMVVFVDGVKNGVEKDREDG